MSWLGNLLYEIVNVPCSVWCSLRGWVRRRERQRQLAHLRRFVV